MAYTLDDSCNHGIPVHSRCFSSCGPSSVLCTYTWPAGYRTTEDGAIRHSPSILCQEHVGQHGDRMLQVRFALCLRRTSVPAHHSRQRIWHTLRRKAMTINGIDGLFSATEDPTMFFLNWEMVRNGKLATLMAICSW